MRPLSRRALLLASSTAACSLTAIPQLTRAQSTPTASPAAAETDPLIAPEDALQIGADTQWLAVLNPDEFDTGHIEGSSRVNWDEMALPDTSEAGIAAWEEEMRSLLSARGVSPDRQAIIYDAGSLFAARGWWQLAYLGFPTPLVLDGGLTAWQEAGGGVVTASPGIDPLEAPHIEQPVRRDMLATKDEILASLGDPNMFILDARSSGEYDDGHIPGAVNAPYTDNAVGEDANVYLSADILRERYEALGMADGKRAVTYCSTGARGAVAAFALEVAGFTDVALYAGSWNEWSSDPSAPIE